MSPVHGRHTRMSRSNFQGGSRFERHGGQLWLGTLAARSRCHIHGLLPCSGEAHFAQLSPPFLFLLRLSSAPSRLRSNPTLIAPRIILRSQSKFPTFWPIVCCAPPTERESVCVCVSEGIMCLVKVKQEEEVVPYRIHQRTRSPPRRRISHVRQSREVARHSRDIERYSRTEIVRESSPRPSASYVSMPSPKPLQIPAPQPVPVFVQPPPPPPPAPMPAPPPPASHVSSHHTHSHHGGAHYVEVSPRSSMSSRSSSPGRSEYVYREREVRRESERYSPENPRYEHYRYVEPASSESDDYDRYQRDRSSQRSRSRAGHEDARGSYRETNTRLQYRG